MKPGLDGEVITLANARRLVRAKYPHAYIGGATAMNGERTFFIYSGAGSQMYIGYGKTRHAAWKDAAVKLARAESAKQAEA